MGFIELKCNNCGANIELDLENLQAYCPYCGQKLMLEVSSLDQVLKEREKTKQAMVKVLQAKEKTKQKNIEREQLNDRDRNQNRTFIIGMVILFLLFAFAFGMLYIPDVISSIQHEKNGDLKIPISAKTIIDGKYNYLDVKTIFEDEGFTDIELIAIPDIIMGVFKKEDIVTEITVNGDPEFSKGTWVSPYAVIRITYHTKKRGG